MGTTIRLGRIAGIPVGFHWSLLVIAGLLTADLASALGSDVSTGVAIAAAAVLAIAFFASVLAHELAHSVVARHHGVEVRGITLWLLGGVARLDGEIPSPGAQLRIAVAGPATSLGLGAAFGALAVSLGALDAPALLADSLMWLAIVNGIVGVFNLIPAAPLDGGRILGAGLWAAHHDRDRATLGAARVGVLFGWALVLLGVWGFVADQSFGLWPALLGWFVVVSAQAEARFAQVRMTLRGISVADAMSPSTGLPGWLTVEAFIERFVDGSVPAFVVERWEGGVAGVVTLDALRMVAAADRGHMRVVELAVPVESLRTAQPGDDLATVWGKPAPSARLPHVVVLSHGKVVGIVSPDTIKRRRAAHV